MLCYGYLVTDYRFLPDAVGARDVVGPAFVPPQDPRPLGILYYT